MRIHNILLSSMLAIVCSMSRGANDSQLESLAGKYAWEGPRANSPGFFEVPSIRASLQNVLPPGTLKILTEELTTGTPNSIVDGYLIVSACRPHACPSKNYIAITNPRNSLVTVVLFDSSAGNDDIGRTRCFSSLPDLRAYPTAVVEEVLGMHIPLMTKDDRLYPRNLWVDQVKCADGSNTSLERTRER
jgi:hypothetical protein